MSQASESAGTAAAPARVGPLPPGIILFGAVLAMSWGGPLVRFTAAPALVVGAWRVLIAVGVIGLVLVATGEWREFARLRRREWALAVGAGLLLAGHFWSWIASLEWTRVSSSVMLVSTQPIFVGLLSALLLGERATRRQWAGIATAVVGAAVLGWGDHGEGASSTFGNALALAGAVFAAGYFVIGRRLRPRLGLWTYTGLVYAVAGAALATAVLLSPGTSLVEGYAASDWLVFAALAFGPMLIGHSGVNYALRYMPAYVANLVVLGEPIGATLIAWWVPAIGEAPTPQLLLGGAFIAVGIVLGVGARNGRAS